MTIAKGTIEAEISANGSANGKLPDIDSGNVVTTDITAEMQTAYLDYAMSVIVSRALPDVRDGLKPVHRRILYAMFSDLNLTSDKPHKKSARIVGEVLGKYHPHGDQAVYDAMVRMAQEFSLRYPLIDGQGNFGSIDGDGAAAMRYTEARLDQISDLMLADLKKDTVDWHDNFDNTLREPDILPAALPNLIINGSNGIAVGMATNIPPHNLAEVIDALAYMIDNFKKVEEITVEDLMQFIKGPDFPTGGILYRFREDKKGEDSTDAVAQGYATGRSRLVLQAKAHFEEMSRNRNRIVVTELPYQTNKTALIERIAALVRDGKIEGITDLRDESDRTGMRIVIELTRTVDATRILERLFKLTPLQQTFGLQMLALVEGEPIILSLRRLLRLFIEHRQEIVRRRSEYELARAKERAHIVEGLLRALDILDEVIATIRSSQRVDTAKTNLMKNFKFTDVQAQAILDMQLRRLAALERKRLQDEYKELLKRIKYLEDLLASPAKMLKVIKEELLKIKEEYGDVRKTQIVERTKGTLTSTDLLPDQDVWVSVSTDGELRRQNATRPSLSDARQASRGGGLAVLNANTQDYLYLFAKDGQCRRVSIHEIPQSGASKHASLYTEFTRRDAITAACTLPKNGGDGGYLFLVSEQGSVKRITVADFLKAAPLDPVVMNVDPKDRLRWVLRTTGTEEIILVSSAGQSIRFKEEEVRSMGLAAGGVGGMKLKKGHHVVFAGVVDPGGELLTMTEKGYTKRTALKQYSTQGRNGGGIVTHKTSARTGDLTTALVLDAASVAAADEARATVVLSNGSVKALPVSDVPHMGRGVLGKVAIALDLGSTVAMVHQIKAPQEPQPNGTAPGSGSSGSRTKASAKGTASGNGGNRAATTRAKRTSRTPRASANGSRGGSGKRSTRKKATAKAATNRTSTAGTGRSRSAKRSTTSRKNSAQPTAKRGGTAKAGGKTTARASAAKTASKTTNARSTAKKTATSKAAATAPKTQAAKTRSTKASSKTTTAQSSQRKTRTRRNAANAASKETATGSKTKKVTQRSRPAKTTTKQAATKSAAQTRRRGAGAKATSAKASSEKPRSATAKSSSRGTGKSTRAAKKAPTGARQDEANKTKSAGVQTEKVGEKPAVTKPKRAAANAARPTTKRSAKLATVTSVTTSQKKKERKKAKQ